MAQRMTLKKHARIVGETRDQVQAELVRRYEKGASIRALAEFCGRSYGFVHRILSESNVTLRGRGGNTRGTRGTVLDNVIAARIPTKPSK